jgi:hypothetical protein
MEFARCTGGRRNLVYQQSVTSARAGRAENRQADSSHSAAIGKVDLSQFLHSPARGAGDSTKPNLEKTSSMLHIFMKKIV